MLLADLEAALRLDLFDPAGANQRWTTSDLDRALDKAVERYSQYYPNIVYADMTTEPYQRTYPYPTPWNSSYPLWWIERVIYPLQAYGSTLPAPAAGMAASTLAGTGLGSGTYQYKVTYLTQGGETPPSPATTINTSSGNQLVMLNTIPAGGSLPALPIGTTSGATNSVIGRNLYRTQAGGTICYLLTTLQDTSTISYTDNLADTALIGRAQPPAINTSGVMLWPPTERDFAEYSNLFDSSTALASGGNLGNQGSIGAGQGPTGS